MTTNKITMPKPAPPVADFRPCVPYLVVHRITGDDLSTVITSPNGVIFFDEDGHITYGTLEYLHKTYVMVRPYAPGEVLSFTQGSDS
jgi:hypothetical protein